MVSARACLDAAQRDPDTAINMVAPGPPGPHTTDEHNGVVHDSPVALVSTNSTAHILDQINPSINPYNLNNDALVKDLARCIDVGDHVNMNDATTTASSASPHLHDLQPNKHSGQGEARRTHPTRSASVAIAEQPAQGWRTALPRHCAQNTDQLVLPCWKLLLVQRRSERTESSWYATGAYAKGRGAARAARRREERAC